ncbi:hypothetical protein DWX40_07800 [Bacteroides stercoris]|jgi:hypothetical protein|uniref:Porin n=2 Tax=Bacteroides stercoris TaxID=46506 RepID=A0A7J5L575_BACSE|nr:putative porin [Bacteroides stercoris]KAB5263186.1 hypothetical protein F9968_07360 [Bacteroides stercoris]KAB5263608.1 hypothetical protein F9966_06100 [Bacteroides stercoris]KAB5282076.1 hypothetical protein F9962_07380 [Bacteroides stercoris]KAB5285546.1 hypothetical protein F9957_07015 [Bacteroides stercoris]KAB5292893.1 hypothetical protein F9959_07440 [Bacteroides stercoris]
MRRIVLTYIFLSIIGILGVGAQNPFNRMDPVTGRDQFGNQVDPNTLPDNLEDSTDTEIQSLPPKLYMWRLSETLGNRTIIPADTANLNFQNTNLVEGMYGHYNYLGNLGSPRMSRIFFERRDNEPTIFMEPFSSFFVRPDEVKFTNSNVPFTNLTYYKAGNKVNGEERFKSYFSVNVNKRLAFGFNIDYLYGRGYYQNQSTSNFNAGIFASYIGNKYQMQAVYNNFTMKMNENGGIQDDRYITRPEDMAEGKKEYESTTIPVKLEQTSNKNKDFYVYLTHRYRLGFTRETTTVEDAKSPKRAVANDSVPLAKDTIITEEFVPVTSFIHTMKVERARHKFSSAKETEGQYPNAYFNEVASRDSTTAFSVKNVFGIALLEGFNKYAKAGLTAYISHKFSRYELMDTLSRTNFDEQEIFVGGELAKQQGKTLHYNVNGEVGIMDKALGQFRVNADLDLNFRLWKDTVNFYARGYVSNTLPSFYMRHYHSNHYYWDNENMDKEFRTRVEGELNISRWKTNLRAGVENIKNYTYFNQNAMPAQESGNIQVLSATLKQDFRLGILHLDNEVTWQKSSNETVLPLPQLSLYHNLYLLAKIAKKVLTVQLGADVRYFTKYNAPAYTPAIQQFHLQAADDQVEIGGYPIVNVYANLHLKRTRIFAMMYHVNAGMGKGNYFLVPHYPINPRLFKIGISWNFYD